MTTNTLIRQLRSLAQLTQTETQIAQLRVVQARTEDVERELRLNAAKAELRYRRIDGALDELNAVPDVVSPVIGRVVAMVKSTVEQAQPIDEALLGDLTLEHQLRDRARYVKVLARRTGNAGIEQLADDLVDAHSATVDWLTTVLAEEALGGPAALRPTQLQRIATGVGRAVSGPARFAFGQVNRAASTVTRAGGQARDATVGTVDELRARARSTGEDIGQGVTSAARTAKRVGEDAAEVATTGRDAALQRTERVAEREGADATAEAVHGTRQNLGALKAAELPIEHYEELTKQAAISAIRELDDPEDLNAVIAFEEAHKNRSGVLAAAQARYAAVAAESAETTDPR